MCCLETTFSVFSQFLSQNNWRNETRNKTVRKYQLRLSAIRSLSCGNYCNWSGCFHKPFVSRLNSSEIYFKWIDQEFRKCFDRFKFSEIQVSLIVFFGSISKTSSWTLEDSQRRKGSSFLDLEYEFCKEFGVESSAALQ